MYRKLEDRGELKFFFKQAEGGPHPPRAFCIVFKTRELQNLTVVSD
jgi:hypothetical protein